LTKVLGCKVEDRVYYRFVSCANGDISSLLRKVIDEYLASVSEDDVNPVVNQRCTGDEGSDMDNGGGG
jgi:hypothetical protein